MMCKSFEHEFELASYNRQADETGLRAIFSCVKCGIEEQM